LRVSGQARGPTFRPRVETRLYAFAKSISFFDSEGSGLILTPLSASLKTQFVYGNCR
jgi:hypothetical protein